MTVLTDNMTFGTFMAPFHRVGENPTLALERDLELIEWLDDLGFDEAWIGEHHSGGWETIASPEVFIEFQAHSDGLSVESRAEGLGPGVNRFRTMFKAQKLPLCGASGLEANIVFRISPVEANKGRKCFGYVWLHV